MKYIAILVLSFYQKILSPLLHQLLGVQSMCRYDVPCSSYMKEAIQNEGFMKGLGKGARRVLSCQPFTNYATL